MNMPIFSHERLDDKIKYVNSFFIQTREVDKTFLQQAGAYNFYFLLIVFVLVRCVYRKGVGSDFHSFYFSISTAGGQIYKSTKPDPNVRTRLCQCQA